MTPFLFLRNRGINSTQIHRRCDNISPPLHWDDVPNATQSLVLIVDDPDAPQQTFVHWVLYDLPSATRNLTENIAPNQPTLPGGARQDQNDFGNPGFGGPCPPEGTHRYFFKLYATRPISVLTSVPARLRWKLP